MLQPVQPALGACKLCEPVSTRIQAHYVGASCRAGPAEVLEVKTERNGQRRYYVHYLDCELPSWCLDQD